MQLLVLKMKIKKHDLLFVAPGLNNKHEAWSKEIRYISKRFKHNTLVLTTDTNIKRLFIKEDNYYIIKHNPILYVIYGLLVFILSRHYKYVSLECSPYTVYSSLLTTLIPNNKIIYKIKSNSFIDDEYLERVNKIIKKSILVLVYSKKSYEKISKLTSKKKIKLISPSIDTEKYVYQPALNTKKPFKLLFASAPIKQGMFPEMFVWKGINLLLDVAEELSNHKIEFYVLWRGVNTSEILDMIKQRKLKNVKIIDKNVKILNYYKKCHATIFTPTNLMYTPDFPSSLMESLSAGRPVIVSNILNITNIIKESNSGVVCKPTIKSVKEAILKMIDSYEKYQENTKNITKKHFNTNFETYEKILNNYN